MPSRRGEKRILGASQDLERFFGEMRKVYRSRRERELVSLVGILLEKGSSKG